MTSSDLSPCQRALPLCLDSALRDPAECETVRRRGAARGWRPEQAVLAAQLLDSPPAQTVEAEPREAAERQAEAAPKEG
jgi:hypothetical protein